MIIKHSQQISRNSQSSAWKSGILQKQLARQSGFLTRVKVQGLLITVSRQSFSHISTFLSTFFKERQCLISCRHSLYFCLLLMPCVTLNPKKESICCLIQIYYSLINIQVVAGMSESNLASKGERFNLDNDDLKRKRRTRNDQDGRNFSCNCGKSYLSYPALYTHVKTKHNGKPEFTKLAQYAKDENESVDIKDDEEIESMEKIEDSNNVQQLKRYLNKFFPLAQKEKDNDKKAREPTKEDLAFLKGVKDYWEKHKKEDQPHENEAYATSIDNVFGRFLIDMDSDISRSCQKYISEFVLNVRASLNELKGNEDYCKANNAFQVPALMNDVFTDKFQKMEEGHLYLRHPTIICKTIYHFSRWLFQERFTNLSLKFNTV